MSHRRSDRSRHRYSRLMSLLTAGYGVYALAEPRHLGSAMTGGRREQESWDQVARVFGVRDLVVSSVALFGRAPETVEAAMKVRIGLDVVDGLLLAQQADDPDVRRKVLGVTLGWASLNTVAVLLDRRRQG